MDIVVVIATTAAAAAAIASAIAAAISAIVASRSRAEAQSHNEAAQSLQERVVKQGETEAYFKYRDIYEASSGRNVEMLLREKARTGRIIAVPATFGIGPRPPAHYQHAWPLEIDESLPTFSVTCAHVPGSQFRGVNIAQVNASHPLAAIDETLGIFGLVYVLTTFNPREASALGARVNPATGLPNVREGLVWAGSVDASDYANYNFALLVHEDFWVWAHRVTPVTAQTRGVSG